MARLPVYLRSLHELAEGRVETVSSEKLAQLAGVNAAKVRKDLSYLGSYGTRGVGYDVRYLIFNISRELGLTQDWPVVIVGIGNLGHALAGYAGFGERGFPVAALLDADPARVGEKIGELTVRHIDDLPDVVHEVGVAVGVVPAGGVPAAIGTGLVTGAVVLVVAAAVMMGTSRRPLLAAVHGLRGSSDAREVAGV